MGKILPVYYIGKKRLVNGEIPLCPHLFMVRLCYPDRGGRLSWEDNRTRQRIIIAVSFHNVNR